MVSVNSNKGWHQESIRHRNAKIYGKAGEPYRKADTKTTVKKADGGITINIKTDVKTPPLDKALQRPIANVVVPEQKIPIHPPTKFKKVRDALGVETSGEKTGIQAMGINIDSPETAFTDFFGGMGEMFAVGTEQAGEKIGGGLLGVGAEAEEVGEKTVMGVEKAGEGVGGLVFPSDDSARRTINGEGGVQGKQSETLNIAEESFGAQTLDDKFEDMAKTKIEMNYLEDEEDEFEAEALAQEERRLAGVAPAPTFRAGEAVGEKAGETLGYVGGKVRAGLTWAKERFRREQGREPSKEEEAVMADQIAEQVVGGQDIPEEVVQPHPDVVSPTPQPPLQEPEHISEQEAEEIVRELQRQKVVRENGGRV